MNRVGMLSAALVLTSGLAGGGVLRAGEWASWRGPDQDGTSRETGLARSVSVAGENLIWKADFIGRSTPVVVDGRVCVIGRVGDGISMRERVACFDAGDGHLVWEDLLPVYQTTVAFNRVGWASLTADSETGIVYAHGVSGQLIAYAPDGKIVWSHFPTETLGRYSGYGGRTQTPMLEGNQLIISFVTSGWGDQVPLRHRYFSFDKRTGEMIWASTPGVLATDFNTQSVPVPAIIGGRRMIVVGDADGWVYGLKAETGEKVWGYQLSKRSLNSTVVVKDGRVYAAHSEENPDEATMGRVVCFKAEGSGDITKTAEVWRANELDVGFPSPAFADGRLYVIDNSANLRALDAATGKALWVHSLGTVGKGSPVVADGMLLAPEVNGMLHFLKPGPAGVEVLDAEQFFVPDGRYAEIYASPAVAYGRIFLSTEGGLYAIGSRQAPFKVVRDAARPLPPAPQGSGEAAWIQVIPAELLLKPGEQVRLRAVVFDADRRVLEGARVTWGVKGLQGRVSADGVFSAEGNAAQTGAVTASIGSVAGSSRARVIPGLPWSEDFEKLETGSTPAHWINAKEKFVVEEKEGGKVLLKAPRKVGLNRSAVYLGSPDMAGYTIEADIMGTKEGRRASDVGLINGGYILELQGAHQRLQMRAWSAEPRLTVNHDLPWEMDIWYRVKFRVDVAGGKALIRGKVWKRDAAEPADWTITVEDPFPIPSGSPGLDAYSPTPLYYDNLRVTENGP